VISVLVRSLKLIVSVKGLFAGKFFLALVAVIPGLIAPWPGKIIVDQVLLQRPFGETDVRFPPFLDPLINLVRDMGPMETMAVIAALYLILLVVFGLRGPGTAYFLAQGQDSATQSENAINAGLSTVGGLWGMVEMLWSVRLTQTLANTLRTRLFERLTRLPMTTLDDHRIGDSVFRVMYDAPEVPSICLNLTLTPFFAVISSIVSLYLMQYSYGEVAPGLIWVAASLMPITLLITLPFSGVMRRANQASRASGTATTNAIEESMDNIGAVQSLGGMSQEKARFERTSGESFKRYRFAVAWGICVGFTTTIGLVSMLFYAVVIVSDRIIDGTMSQGDFWVLVGLFFNMGGAAMNIGRFWIDLQAKVAAIRRVFFFFGLASEDPGEDLTALGDIREGVVLEHVDFSYPDGRRALSDIHVELPVGELVAIVGPTGSGKTSLAYLTPGFLRPTRGRVLIDGEDIAHVSIDSLRRQVAYVFQEHLLLSESIRSNLLLVKPDATEAKLVDACRAAGAMEFIDVLPEGMDTVLGRAGDTLSVGQKQRLCIARGLIRNTKILILDEPTAALDPQMENQLVSGLQRAAKGRLVIVIAHRLSTVRLADRIIFLEDGHVRDVGNHDTLMADPDSPYRRFVELQEHASTDT